MITHVYHAWLYEKEEQLKEWYVPDLVHNVLCDGPLKIGSELALRGRNWRVVGFRNDIEPKVLLINEINS